MDIGFDPISLENIKVDEWLKDDPNVLVIDVNDDFENNHAKLDQLTQFINDEILSQNKTYMQNGGKIINPIPKFKIYKNEKR